MTVTDSNATNCGAVGGGGGFLFSKRNNLLTVSGCRFETITQNGNEGGVKPYFFFLNIIVCLCLFVFLRVCRRSILFEWAPCHIYQLHLYWM
jgi:hypothetical protein